jgi:cobalt/nickel transport protein
MSNKKFFTFALVLCLGLAGGASFYASSQPDGLEKVAEDVGFIETAEDNANADTPLLDYEVSGVENDRISKGLAGVIGVLGTAAVSGGLFLLIRRKSSATSK